MGCQFWKHFSLVTLKQNPSKQNLNQNSVKPSFASPCGALAMNQSPRKVEVDRSFLSPSSLTASLWFIFNNAQPVFSHVLLRLNAHHPCLIHITVPAPFVTVLARGPGGTLWNNNKKPSNLPEKFGNIAGFTWVSGDDLSGSVLFNGLPCAKKNLPLNPEGRCRSPHEP